MKSELFQVVQQRAAVQDSRVKFINLQSRQPEYESMTDAEGSKLVARKSLSLIEKLLVRGGVTKASPAPLKRRRGRPKGSVKGVAQVVAGIWDDVTGGAGVVLVDG